MITHLEEIVNSDVTSDLMESSGKWIMVMLYLLLKQN